MLNFCPQCGAARAEGAAYCGQCGRSFDDTAGAVPPPYEPTPASRWSPQGAPPEPPPGIATPSGSPFASNDPPVYSWAPPAMSPAATVPHVSRTLGTWLQVLTGITGAAYVFVALSSVAARAAFDDFIDAGAFDFSAFQDFEDADDVLSATQGLAFLFDVALVILLIIWLYQLTRSVGRHGATNRRWSPGWAVGGWFIPIAAAVIPWLIFREGEKIASAAATGRTAMWMQVKLHLTSNLWWICVIAGQILFFVGSDSYTNEIDPDDVRTGTTMMTIGALTVALGAVLLIPVIRRITRYDHTSESIAPLS